MNKSRVDNPVHSRQKRIGLTPDNPVSHRQTAFLSGKLDR